MATDVFFRDDAARILSAVAVARDGLTVGERAILAAICAGFGISLAEVLPERPARLVMIVREDGDGNER
jgi:tellurite resistance protein